MPPKKIVPISSKIAPTNEEILEIVQKVLEKSGPTDVYLFISISEDGTIYRRGYFSPKEEIYLIEVARNIWAERQNVREIF